MSSSNELTIVVKDIEPIHGERVIGTLKPGINVLRGANRSGKSTTGRLIQAATSNTRIKATDFEVVAGAARGTVRFAGKTLVINRDGSAARKGDAPPVEPLPPVFDVLNDPGLVGAQPRAEARLRALCEAFGILPVYEALRRLLPADDDPAWADIAAVAEETLSGFERIPPASLPAAAKILKAKLQERRRDVEESLGHQAQTTAIAQDRAARAQEQLEAEAGEELAKAKAGGDKLVEQLEEARQEATRLKAERDAATRQRAERQVWEEQVAQLVVSENLPGLEAGLAVAEEERYAATKEAEDTLTTIRKLELTLATARERMAFLARKSEDFKARIAQAKRQQEQAASLRAKLAQLAEESSVDDMDVELAQGEVDRAERLIGYRRRLQEVEAQQQAAEAAEQLRVELAEKVRNIDAADSAVWRRLGDILAERLDGEVRVVDGHIETMAKGEWRDLDSRALSEGQRWEIVLGWMIQGAVAAPEVRVVAMVEQGDCPIDDSGLRRLSPLAAAKNLSITVEKEEDGADLRLDYMGGA